MTLTLWDVLREKAPPVQAAQVETLVEHAAVLLGRIPDSFPTYTLHDRTHADNVITMMERLLGPHLPQVTGLEAAILILAAYYHDIGMVFSDAERATLKDAPDFAAYLAGHPGAALAVAREGDCYSGRQHTALHEGARVGVEHPLASSRTSGHAPWPMSSCSCADTRSGCLKTGKGTRALTAWRRSTGCSTGLSG